MGAVALTGIFALSAQANLPGSNFEGSDGNLIVTTTGDTDWVTAPARTLGVDLSASKSDDAFGQGTKEDNANVTVVEGSIPPNKNDLTRFYTGTEQVTDGDIFLYLGWERLVNIGNANLDFEINQNPTTGWTSTTQGPLTINRTAGDLLVTYDFGGSGTPTLGINTWVTSGPASQCFSANAVPCWGNHLTLGSTIAEGAVNTGTIVDTIGSDNVVGGSGQPGSLTAGLFGEASINLTQAGVFPSGVCKAFGSAFVKSRSSSSFTAELKDFIAPEPVNISNCGSITIKKVVQNAPSGDTTSFSYTDTGGLDPTSFSLTAGGTKTFSNLNAGSYSVTEGSLPASWDLKSLTCDTSTGVTISKPTVTINLALGQNVTCSYTNHYTNSPTIATTLSATTVNIGDSVTDSATLTGGSANAGGTVTYHAYAGANTCTGTDLLNSTKTVTNGVVPDSDSITFTTAGPYSFQAVYSGDANNNGATSVCSTEQLLVKTNPTIATTLSDTSVVVGSSVHDSSTLSGATSDASGTVTYTVYDNNTCSGTGTAAGTETVTGGVVPDSDAITFNTPGDFYWQAVYSGDAKNNGATSTCTDEHLVVNKAPTSLTTAQRLRPQDSVTVTSTAGGTPTGDVTFSLYANATCTGTPAYTETKALSAAGTAVTANTDFDISSASASQYNWLVSYAGDSLHKSISGSCGAENFTLTIDNGSAVNSQ